MIEVTRSPHRILPDPGRVVARPFVPGSPNFGAPADRLDRILQRIVDLTAVVRAAMLDQARATAAGRHRDIEAIWRRHHRMAADRSPLAAGLDGDDLLLVGAYLTQEYAYEAAALTNPSIVPFGAPGGFVLSARAIGEGHISSIAFLTGRVGPDGAIHLDERSPFATNGTRRTPTYDKAEFAARLDELGAANHVASQLLAELGDTFGHDELETAVDHVAARGEIGAAVEETLRRIRWLASSNYVVEFDTPDLSERLVSPAGPAESNGMEDARFTPFTGDDGAATYYATYTAYDGRHILPQLIETRDFRRFRIATLRGPMSRNKGMALFPRRVGGLYAALSRHDGERTYLLLSDRLRDWRNAELVVGPEEGWEAIKGGNGGSPLELDDGWLVITHGVGPMRRYALGAILLDRDEPAKVIARLRGPLLEPGPEERDGYVPNIVYTCGAMLHAGRLVLPYGFSDRGIGFATVEVDALLSAMG